MFQNSRRVPRYGTRFALACAAVGALALAGCGAADSRDEGSGSNNASSSSGEYKIGAVLSLSGHAAGMGSHQRDGARYAVDEINAAGGVNGRKLRLDVRDDAGDPNKTVSVFNRFAADDEVLAVFGGTFGSFSLSILPISKRVGLPMLAPNSTHSLTRSDSRYLFRVVFDADAEVTAAVDRAKAEGAKRVAILHGTDAYGEQGSELLKEAIPAAGLELVGSEGMPADARDVTPQLTKLRASRPDVLMLWGTSPNVGVALKNAGQLRMEIPMLSGVGGLDPGNLDVAEGSPALAHWTPQDVDGSGDPELNKRFAEGFKAKNGRESDYVDRMGYDTMYLIKQGLENAGDDVTRDGLVEGLEQIQDKHLLMGVWNFGPFDANEPDNRSGLTAEAISWKSVEDGRLVPAAEPTR